jgi:hypothetical protein
MGDDEWARKGFRRMGSQGYRCIGAAAIRVGIVWVAAAVRFSRKQRRRPDGVILTQDS